MLSRHALASLLLASLASAQGAKFLGKDDLDFARALNQAGYSDLADVVIKAYEKANAGGKGSSETGMLQLELEMSAALREPDPLKRLDRLADLVNSKEDFVEKNQGTPVADEVQDTLPDLYGSIGELTVSLVEDEEYAARADDLRKRGSAMFERAIDSLTKRIEGLTEARAAQAPPPEDGEGAEQEPTELDRRFMIARYSLARTYYFHARLIKEGEFLRKSRLDQALDVLSEFQLDYGGQFLEFESYIYEGLCLDALGQTDEAISAFDSAINLRAIGYERSASGVYQMPEVAADIVSSAVLQKMLLLAKKGDHVAAAAAARDFYTSTPEPAEALRGRAILSQEAEAYLQTGDQQKLEMVAKELIRVDPTGPGGARGRELLGGGAPKLGAAEAFRLAQGAALRGDHDSSVRLCQEVLAGVRGAPELQDLGSQAGLLLGGQFAVRGMWHEAAVVWDTAADRFEKGKEAPECLWQSVQAYLNLRGSEQSSYFQNLASERMGTFTKRYPQHPYASQAAIVEGKKLEVAGKFGEAAEMYQRIGPGRSGYEEALYKAGGATYRHARKLKQDGRAQEASTALKQAEELLKKAIPALEAAATKTLEVGVQDRMRAFAFSAQLLLADICLLDDVKRPADVLAYFRDAEQVYSDDANKLAAVQDRRLRAMIALGKIDEAIALLDRLVQEDPNAKGLSAAAAPLAQELDRRATALREKDPDSSEADRLFRQAARFYMVALRGQLEGTEAIRAREMEPIADRLFSLALQFNGVPKTIKSFVDWNGGPLYDEMLEFVVRAYEALLPLTPSYRTRIALAQTLAFLGRWTEAATHYADLFERESMVDPITKALRQDVVRAKPELIFAYLEWGVCEHAAGKGEDDATRVGRARNVFETLVLGTVEGDKLWWQAKYYFIEILNDQGDYRNAKGAIDGLELKYPDYDEGKYHLKERFVRLRDELKNKVFEPNNRTPK